MRILMTIAFSAAAIVISGTAFAQETCQKSAKSCSGMYADCQKLCGNSANPARCAASTCDVSVSECKATGVWRSRAQRTACWVTTNKS